MDQLLEESRSQEVVERERGANELGKMVKDDEAFADNMAEVEDGDAREIEEKWKPRVLLREVGDLLK